jgi:hypothetical protein
MQRVARFVKTLTRASGCFDVSQNGALAVVTSRRMAPAFG